jgi:phosphopantothenoylcysteine synthetase/decarboxylase
MTYPYILTKCHEIPTKRHEPNEGLTPLQSKTNWLGLCLEIQQHIVQRAHKKIKNQQCNDNDRKNQEEEEEEELEGKNG